MTDKKLAMDGGEPARTRPSPPMYPGGNEIDEEEAQAVLETLRAKRLFRYYGPNPGPSQAAELEKEFAAHSGAGHALGVTSGTAALICGLRGIGVGPGDEVIVPGYTWIASAAAVLAVGAVPVVAEVDDSLTLDPVDAEARITPHTKAIMPVHMRGMPCNMDAISDLAQRRGLKLIEDVAQADGASYHGRRLGTYGDVGCFSLQFNKIITSGEGGMVITSDDEVWKRAVMWHDVIGGLRGDFPRDEILWGVNFRMPELLAAVARVQLRRLDGLLTTMRARKAMLQGAVAPVAARKGVAFPTAHDAKGDASVCMIMLAPDAAAAKRMGKALEAEGVDTWQLYDPEHVDYHVYAHWIPVVEHRNWSAEGGPWRSAHREVSYGTEVAPRTLDLLSRTVHLDINPLYTNEDIEETAEAVVKVIEGVL
jgi:dTDP-4-amino-4,6-dideoxygalactose transaminase